MNTSDEESASLFRMINDISFDAVIIHDRGIILDANEKFCELTRYPREELVGMDGLHLIEPSHRDQVKLHISSDNEKSYSTVILRRDGRTLDIQVQRRIINYHGKKVALALFRDVSELQKINEALIEANTRLKEAQELARIGSWGLDISTGKTSWSRESFRIFGISPSESPLTYDDLKKMIHPEDLDVFTADTDACITQGTPFNHQVRFVMPDDRILYIIGRGKKTIGPDEKTPIIIGTIQDISEIKVYRDALKASEEKFRNYVELAPVGIFIADRQGNYIEVNRAACEITGYSESELIGKNLAELIPPNDFNNASEHFKRVVESGSASGDLEYIRKDGSIGYWNVRAIKLGENRLMGITTDLSVRKKTEEALKNEKDRTRKYLDITQVMIVVLRPDQSIEMINRKGCEILGYRNEELTGKNWFDLCIPEPIREEVKAVFDRIISGDLEPVEYFENNVVTRTGGERLIAWHNAVIKDSSGEVTGILSSGEDITESKRSEDLLKESQERFDLAIGATDDAIWDRNIEKATMYFSPRWYTMLGYRPDQFEASYDLWKSMIHPDDLEKAEASIEKVLSTPGMDYRMEFRMKTAQGTWKWILSRGKVVKRDDNGNPLRFTGTHTDITVRKKVEDALRQSETKFRLLFENMIEGVALHELDFDEEGRAVNYRIFDINPAFTRHTGMDATNARGALATTFYGVPAAPYLEEYAEVVKSKEPLSFETYFPPQAKYYKISAFHLGGARFATVFEDITDYKTATEELRASREQLDLALDASSDAIWDWNMAEDKVYYSPRWFTMLGYNPDEFEGVYDTWNRLVHPDDIENAREKIHEAVENPDTPYKVEFRMKTRDDQWKWILARGKIVKRDKTGKPVRFIGTHTDLTEIKRVEEEKAFIARQLSQAQKMEAIGTLAGGLAHDFNNVLGAMKGSLDIVETYLSQEKLENREKIYKYLATAQQSSQRAADIIKQLMALSRVEKQRLIPVDLNDSLKNIRKIAENSFPKSVSLDFRFTATPMYILADATQIEQVLLNLCVNASHAMTIMREEDDREGGDLKITMDLETTDDDFIRSHPGARSGQTYVRISVSDTGIGIQEEDKKRIFEPFFTTKDINQGTGLGLSMVYNIVNAHEGFIHVYSEPGVGTTISVFFPRMAPKDSIIQTAQREMIIRGSGKIMVIDDEENILEVVNEFLSQFGYSVVLAHGALNGLEIYRREHAAIDAVILDLSMPVMSGYDLFKELKAVNPEVRVLVSSGFIHDDRVEKMMKAGARGFISKPYTRSSLSKIVREILQ